MKFFYKMLISSENQIKRLMWININYEDIYIGSYYENFHFSYHANGIFHWTMVTDNNKPKYFAERQLEPIEKFKDFFQFGSIAIEKNFLVKLPPIKNQDLEQNYFLIDGDKNDLIRLNIILLEPKRTELIPTFCDEKVHFIYTNPWIVIQEF